MRLWGRIVLRIALAMVIIFAVWVFLFHRSVTSEVNNNLDKALTLKSEEIIEGILIKDSLFMEDLLDQTDYSLDTLSREQAGALSPITYSNEEVYDNARDEEIASRVLRTQFRDDEGNYLMLTLSTPTLQSRELGESITLWSIILFLSLLAVIVALCGLIVGRGMRPLYRLLRWIGANDITREVEPLDNPTRITEYRKLNHAVIESAQRSKRLYEQQRQFIGNAAHELQTPVAICRNRMELLLDTPLSEGQMEQVVKTRQTLIYLARLNKELLLLSRIENGQYSERENIDIRELIERQARELQTIYESQEIRLTLDTDSLEFSMNPVLAQVLTGNLLKNAFVYNCKQGEIIVSIHGKRVDIANSSTTGSLEKEPIFDRFYHKGEGENSTGLGLSLVKAIADMHEIEVTYHYDNQMHHFALNF